MAISYNTRIVTTPTSLITNDDEVIFSNVTSPSTLTLPSLSSGNKGRTYIIKDYSGNSRTNPITILPPVSKLIDNESFAIVNTPFGRVWITFDGVNWKTLAI